jgi:hypothetical protein
MDELSSLSGHLMEPLASILAHIIVYFDCDDTLKPQCAVDIQRFFQNSANLKFTSPLFMILQFKESMRINLQLVASSGNLKNQTTTPFV